MESDFEYAQRLQNEESESRNGIKRHNQPKRSSIWSFFSSSHDSRPIPGNEIQNMALTSSAAVETSLRYRDCRTNDEKIRWLNSAHGQNVLAQRPRLKSLHEEGKLVKMIASPQWACKLDDWLTPSSSLASFAGLNSMRERVVPETPYTGEAFSESVLINMMVNGYAVLPAFVLPSLFREAIRYINHSLGEKGFLTAVDSLSKLTSIPTQEKAVLDLFHMSGLAYPIDVLLHGEASTSSSLLSGSRHAQIALRFPELGSVPVDGRLGGLQWHIDGMDKGDHSPFTLLVGIALSDQTSPFMGNLCVWPGSHHHMQGLIQDSSSVGLRRGTSSSSFGITDAFDPVVSRPDLGEPEQLLLNQGDVVILHQKVAHRGGPNLSPDIRRMVYFRIQHRRHSDLRGECLNNLWVELEGMRSVL